MVGDKQKAFIRKYGYLVVPDLLSSQLVEECEMEIDRLHDLAVEFKSKNDPRAEKFQHEPFAEVERVNGRPVLRKIEPVEEFSQVFDDLAIHQPLVDLMRRLLGPDLLLFRSTLMLKPAFHGSIHTLHQDVSYWPVKSSELITVSIALTDSTPDNGCFKVIPGSHHWPSRKWGEIIRRQDEGLTDLDNIDTTAQIDVPLKAGSALLFDSALVHGSGPNCSPNPRHTALFAYFTPGGTYHPHKDATQYQTFRVICGLEGHPSVTLHAETSNH